MEHPPVNEHRLSSWKRVRGRRRKIHCETPGLTAVIGGRKETHHTSDRSARQSILRSKWVRLRQPLGDLLREHQDLTQPLAFALVPNAAIIWICEECWVL